MLEKNFKNNISVFFADFGEFAHIRETKEISRPRAPSAILHGDSYFVGDYSIQSKKIRKKIQIKHIILSTAMKSTSVSFTTHLHLYSKYSKINLKLFHRLFLHIYLLVKLLRPARISVRQSSKILLIISN